MKAKILVMDDEVQVCDILKRFLETKGYGVITATSAITGLEMLAAEKPRVVLLDVRMPGLSGLDAIEEIFKIDGSVGVIMATGVVDENVAREAMRRGASDYILKPFDLDYLEKSLLGKLAMLD